MDLEYLLRHATGQTHDTSSILSINTMHSSHRPDEELITTINTTDWNHEHANPSVARYSALHLTDCDVMQPLLWQLQGMVRAPGGLRLLFKCIVPWPDGEPQGELQQKKKNEPRTTIIYMTKWLSWSLHEYSRLKYHECTLSFTLDKKSTAGVAELQAGITSCVTCCNLVECKHHHHSIWVVRICLRSPTVVERRGRCQEFLEASEGNTRENRAGQLYT